MEQALIELQILIEEIEMSDAEYLYREQVYKRLKEIEKTLQL